MPRRSPTWVNRINRYNLHRKHQYLGILPTGDDTRIAAYKFKHRQNKQEIIYFNVAKDFNTDSSGDDAPLACIDAVLEKYKSLRVQGQIDPKAITIIPLVQVNKKTTITLKSKNRNHFNTIVIQGDTAHIVEPRSSNFSLGERKNVAKADASFVDYPTQVTRNKISAMLQELHPGQRVHTSNIFTEQQSFFNDEDCAKWHCAHVEAAAQAKDTKQPRAFRRLLQNCNLDRRNNDEQLHADTKAFDEHPSKSAVAAPVAPAEPAAKSGDDELVRAREEDADVAEFEAGAEKIARPAEPMRIYTPEQSERMFHAFCNKHDVNANKAPAEKTTNDALIREAYRNPDEIIDDRLLKQEQRQSQIAKAKAYIREYLTADRDCLSIFLSEKSRHSREDTANWLIAKLGELEASTEKNNCNKAQGLLFNYYASIEDKKGKMSRCLEKALVVLFDCQNEYAANPSHASEILMERIRILQSAKSNKKAPGDAANSHDLHRRTQALFNYIQSRETSWSYKYGSEATKGRIRERLALARSSLEKIYNKQDIFALSLDDARKIDNSDLRLILTR